MRTPFPCSMKPRDVCIRRFPGYSATIGRWRRRVAFKGFVSSGNPHAVWAAGQRDCGSLISEISHFFLSQRHATEVMLWLKIGRLAPRYPYVEVGSRNGWVGLRRRRRRNVCFEFRFNCQELQRCSGNIVVVIVNDLAPQMSC